MSDRQGSLHLTAEFFIFLGLQSRGKLQGWQVEGIFRPVRDLLRNAYGQSEGKSARQNGESEL